jgi:hypothetical protein
MRGELNSSRMLERERERERERRYSNPLSKENEHDAKLWSSSFVLIHYLRKLSTWVPKSG